MKVVVWGFEQAEEAEEVIIIREKDLRDTELRKPLIEKISSLMRENPHEDPESFFEATRISILAAPGVWVKFLLALKEFEQEELVKNYFKKEGKICSVYLADLFLI